MRGSATAQAQGRFPPGELLLERYRIVDRVGKGGMGDVYRADDLKLDQPVALKFLPPALGRDPERLERFFGEVRTARQVSHPAVCRVYDIAEVDGEHFLSMEYVDGEDLASLLRRIGRLSGAKALDIARQICAGLAAAHEKRVLHRDLKPENVMIDEQGKVRIADFGLAGIAESFEGDEVRSGTPAYMSPEQLAGREVTVKSDIYALGLVLYELFTGRRAFGGKTLSDLKQQHLHETPEPPSSLVADLDPAIESAILRCLDKDPRRRPGSPLVVSALLPGGDPLAAAIAAGETPSPEMVAAAGPDHGLSPATAWACLAATAAGLFAAIVLWSPRILLGRVPLGKPPAVLEDRARTLLHDLGAGAGVANARGYLADAEYVRSSLEDPSPTRWDGLGTGEPPVIQFWYRESPQPLVSSSHSGRVAAMNPPLFVSGMAGVRLAPGGQLTAFYRVPPQVEDAAAGPTPAPPDWSRLFAEAGLDPARFKPVVPLWTPPFFCDARAAWEGVTPRRGIPMRVEAAAYRGQPVFFQLVAPWTRPDRVHPFRFTPAEMLGQALVTVILLALIGIGGVLARRHLQRGRGDRRGALRLAAWSAVVGFLSWALAADHVRDRNAELGLAMQGAGLALLLATVVWTFYMALEPYVRRLKPEMLISWARLLAGKLADPLVGRDALVGTVWGTAVVVFVAVMDRVPGWLGQADASPEFGWLDALLGLRRVLVATLDCQLTSMTVGMAILLAFLLLFLAVRRPWAAALGLVGLFAALEALQSDRPWWLSLASGTVLYSSLTLLLLRFGLLAVVAGLYVTHLLYALPLVPDLMLWASTPTITALAVVGALAVFGFRTAVRGEGFPRP
jgi:serine/threonine-protein kinase